MTATRSRDAKPDKTEREARRQWLAWLVLGLLSFSGCAMATTYGRAPRQSPLDPDVYDFTVYFNQFASQEDTDRKAAEQFESFGEAHGYVAWRVAKRACQNLLKSKCDYQTRFFRSEEDATRFETAGQQAGSPDATRATPSQPVASSGSGFLVNSSGTLVTNAHVVEDCAQLTVEGRDAALLRVDRANDLAAISTNLTGPHLDLRSGKGAQLGESVMAAGYPLQGILASSGHVTYGTITATAGLGDDTRFVQMSAPVQPGNSGGPLLDQTGRVIGVVTSKLDVLTALALTDDVPENVNFAVKTELLSVFLGAAGVQFDASEGDRDLSNVELAQVGTAATHPVLCRKNMHDEVR